jgi:hypothetical protein
MTQGQIDVAVARATGETIAEIRRRGFNLVDPHYASFDSGDAERSPQVVDWEELAEQRPSLFP